LNLSFFSSLHHYDTSYFSLYCNHLQPWSFFCSICCFFLFSNCHFLFLIIIPKICLKFFLSLNVIFELSLFYLKLSQILCFPVIYSSLLLNPFPCAFYFLLRLVSSFFTFRKMYFFIRFFKLHNSFLLSVLTFSCLINLVP
jgi:hypothetical protein